MTDVHKQDVPEQDVPEDIVDFVTTEFRKDARHAIASWEEAAHEDIDAFAKGDSYTQGRFRVMRFQSQMIERAMDLYGDTKLTGAWCVAPFGAGKT